MEKVIRGKEGQKFVNLNRRKAIHERCLNCCGWVHIEVKECSLSTCELHPFRNGNSPQNSAERMKAIRRYCLSCMNGQVGEVSKCTTTDCPLHVYRMGALDKTRCPDFPATKTHRKLFFIKNNRNDKLHPPKATDEKTVSMTAF